MVVLTVRVEEHAQPQGLVGEPGGPQLLQDEAVLRLALDAEDVGRVD